MCVQKRHALRCYCQAMQVYKGKGWSLAEDHINFTIGRQSFTLRQPENAVSAFRHILTNDSQQTATQQGAFLREYLYVYKVTTLPLCDTMLYLCVLNITALTQSMSTRCTNVQLSKNVYKILTHPAYLLYNSKDTKFLEI